MENRQLYLRTLERMPAPRLFGRESGTHSRARTICRKLPRKNPQYRNTKGNGMKHFFVRLIKEKQGQDLVEDALIVAAGGLARITSVNQMSTAGGRLCFRRT